MGAIPERKLELVKNLYYQRQLSARAVGEKLGVPIDAVYAFMRKHKLPRRTFQEDNRLRFERKPLSFCIKKHLSAKDEELKAVGTALYWGEGHKGGNGHGIDFANSDPRMIKIFLRFFRSICRVDESRLRVLLYCYADQNVGKLINFWSKNTLIPKTQFSKPYVREDFQQNKSGKMPFGLIHIRYMDKKLLMVILQWIEEYEDKFAQVVP